jgi:dipeptidyl aminopeptidase/acylaminoacyl peptidase
MSRAKDPKWTAFVLGELETPEKESILEELERDPTALENIERLREISSLIRESLEDPLPFELTDSQRKSILALSDERRHIRRFLVAAAAVVILLAAGLTTLWMRSARTAPGPAGSLAFKPAAPGTPSLSQSTELDSQRGGRPHPIVMVERTGKAIREIAPAQAYYGFRLSPDERLVAIDCCADSNNREIWLIDLLGGPERRLTFGGGSTPVWSPDGRVIAFSDPATDRLYKQSSDGSNPRLALSDGVQAALDWSPDGNLIMFQRRGGGLWVESSAGGVPFAGVQSRFMEKDARFSPDGRWLAYTSNDTGRLGIYVASAQDTGAKYVISDGSGGSSPRWSRDGRHLFYIAPGGQLMSVDLGTSPNSFQVSRPRMLFLLPSDLAQFEVFANAERFLVFGSSG